MRIVVARRIAQVFFFVLLIWFCIVTTLGTKWFQLRGWPVNLFLQLDPLVGIGTVLSTHTLYRGLAWGAVTIIVTLLLGRVFCGWVCPFGALHQFFGWLGSYWRKPKERMALNAYRWAQRAKYYILLVFLVMAALPLAGVISLQTGLLDPIPLVSRSVNLVVLPTAQALGHLPAAARHYDEAWLIGAVFFIALCLNLVIPRFFCRYICPTGALLGLCARYSIFRIRSTDDACTHCKVCEIACEGACDPAGKVRVSECLMCMNCLDNRCFRNSIGFGAKPSVMGDVPGPDVGRRGVLVALASSVVAIPMVRLGGTLGSNWNPRVVRPPGSLTEPDFLARCIKCGQCMRVCPTNVIVPDGVATGLENLWTPVLNFRIGTSGCQLNCVACSHVCPTAAIRPISLDEKLGLNKYAEKGPIRLGTAFVDRGRCMPWAMDVPCIVCQENCPVTPKAINVKEIFTPVRPAGITVDAVVDKKIMLSGPRLPAGRYGTGDYFLARSDDSKRWRVARNAENELELAEAADLKTGDSVRIEVRLLAPVVDPALCIGCGVCQHECPVTGLSAIRVSAENESRNPRNSFTVERRQRSDS